MRFLADESCDFAIVRALRAAGHDVLAVQEISPRSEDPEVIELAIRENRVLLTEDKDFGQLVFAHGGRNTGIVLIRFPSTARKQIADDVVRLVEIEGEGLKGCFAVLQPGRVRISRSQGEG